MSPLVSRMFRRLGGCALAALAALVLPALPAHAQAIVAIVNGAPISTMDVNNRAALLRLTGKPASQKDVLDELIEERLKLLEARRLNFLPTDAEVDFTFATIAGRSKLTAAQLTQALASRGVNASTLKARIRAELGWGQFVRQKFRAMAVVREQDVVAAVEKQVKTEADKVKAVTYTVRQVIFVMPKNPPDALVGRRRQEASAARSRFKGCEQGVEFVKGLRDVAVKDPINRPALSLSPALREKLEKTPVGTLSEPEKTDLGIEMVAVCERKEGTGTTALQQVVEEKMKDEQFDIQARKYLNDLKVRAIIEYR